jgi:hypothetical protein
MDPPLISSSLAAASARVNRPTTTALPDLTSSLRPIRPRHRSPARTSRVTPYTTAGEMSRIYENLRAISSTSSETVVTPTTEPSTSVFETVASGVIQSFLFKMLDFFTFFILA